MTSEIRVRVVEMPEPHPPETTEEPFRPSLNAILLLAVILLGSLWTWLYSDWFAVVSGTLGFAVLLSAMPTLRGYMSSDRNKQWGKLVDRLLFQSKLMTTVYAALLAAILIIGFCLYQPIAIRAAETESSTAVTVTLHWAKGDKLSVWRMLLEPGETKRQPVLRPFMGGPDRVVVKASALPLLERDLGGLYWERIDYPQDFWSNPALLLYPAPAVLGDLRDRTHDLRLSRIGGAANEGPCLVQEDYLGEPVWLGTGGRALPVSSRTQTRWREQAALHAERRGPPDLASRVIGTAIAPECLKSIAPGDTIEWQLTGSNSSLLHSGSVTVAANDTYPIEAAMEASP